MKRALHWIVLVLLAAVGSSAHAEGPLGIVLMHGKLGVPLAASSAHGALAARLQDAGYLVATPELCWSKARSYDRSYADCQQEIDAAVADLRSRGAGSIVVAGLSLGGNAAIAYGVRHPEVRGVIALSPADDPGRKLISAPQFAASLAHARALVAQGKGDERTSFDEVNTGDQGTYAITLVTTPGIFLSFYDDDAPSHMPVTIARLTVPLLWVAGDGDPSQRGGRAYAFDRAPARPLNRYVTVHASHIEVVDVAVGPVLDWLKELNAAP